MKALPLVTCAFAVLVAALPMSSPVEAGTGIQRCRAADGTTVYTDHACNSLQARSEPMSGELLTRIARQEAYYGDGPTMESSQAIAPMPMSGSRRSAVEGCARSPTQLAMDLQGSLALGDVNRIAESYNWVGRSNKEAKPIMQRLERLTRQPLTNIQFFDARIGSDALSADASGRRSSDAGIMQITLGEPLQVMDMQVQQYAGCYFVRF